MHLQLLLFGHYQLRTVAGPAKFATDHARALLAYLAVEARPHQRTSLAALLWPEQPETAARQNLRQALVYLKKAFQPLPQLAQQLEVTGKTVYLHPETLTTDVVSFRQLLTAVATHDHSTLLTCLPCLQRLQAAAALYVGEFLQGFFIKNSPSFEEWALYTREQLHHQAVELFYTLTRYAETTGDYQAMQQMAARQLMLEPWREEAHVQRMRALALSGQTAAALAHYATCARVLEEELGVKPAPETTALYEQIRTGQLRNPQAGDSTKIAAVSQRAPLPSSQPESDPPPPAAPPLATAPTTNAVHYDWAEMATIEQFHGRSAEIAHLKQWLHAAEYRLIAILGMGGLGKTTLAAQVAKTVAPHFVLVIWRSLLNAPPLSELLDGWLRTLSGQRLTTLPTAIDAQLRLLLTYLQAARCLLVLDNLESIMQSGAAAGALRTGYENYAQLWQSLALTAHQSCLLLTSREEPEGLQLLANQSSRVALLHLAGLDHQAGTKLLQVHGVNTTPARAQALIDHYSGNPLALQLVANTILDLFAGDITAFQRDGAPIFDDIRTVLQSQFVRLSPLEQELLFWLAIEREATSLQRLEENLAQQPPKRAFVEALRALQRRSLIEHNNATFSLQNVMIEYLTDQLIETMVADLTEQLHDVGASPDKLAPDPARPLPARPFNRYALLKADVKESVRQSQLRLILQPVALRLIEHFGRAGLATGTKWLLNRLRTTMPQQPGYAAGNLLNLLQEWGFDLQGLNFANLTIWQADLRDALLHHCDFTGANLARALFTDNFGLINTVAISPDGSLLAAGASNGVIRLWQRHDRRPAGTIQGHDAHIWTLVFSPDGRWLASSADDQQIRIWDLKQADLRHAPLILQGHQGGVHTIAFSPDSRTLASGGHDQQIRLWETTSGQCQRILRGHTGCVYSVAFSPDGQSLVSGSDDQCVRVWDLGGRAHAPSQPAPNQANPTQSDHEEITCWCLQGHRERVYSVAFSPDGKLIASGSTDQRVCLWDWHGVTRGGQLRQSLVGHTHLVRTVAFSPDGQMLASGGYDETIRLWHVASGQIQQTLTGHRAWIRSIAFSPDGQQLISGGFDYTIRLWDLQPGHEQQHYLLRGYTNLMRAVAFGPDGQTIASGSDDQIVRLWALSRPGEQVEQPTVVRLLRGHTRTIRALAFSPDGRWLASGGYDYKVCVWRIAKGDSQSGALCHTLHHTDLVRAVAFSPDSQTIATASSDRTLCLWDGESGTLRLRLTGHTDSVWGVAFSPDGQTVASCSADLTIKLWRRTDGHLLHSFQAHTRPVKAIAFSPDGQFLASGSEDHSVRVWALATGHLLYRCLGHTDFIWSVAFSPDGQTLASSSSDRTIRLWDLRNHQPHAGEPPPLRHCLTGHGDWVWMVAFSPDGQTLVSCSDDETVKLWQVTTGACQQTLRAPRPYAGMKINGVNGLSVAQKLALKALGAIEADPEADQLGVTDAALPATLTPLVGRTAELAALATLLQNGTVRLLTLIGPGGMGKTRLAQEVGRRNQADFVDGVYFVALAPLTNAAELAPAIAAALKLPVQGSEPSQLLRQRLRSKQLLLILDNFEHLLPSALAQASGKADGLALDLVHELLQQAPQLQILVTSRERLNLPGEQLYNVAGLPFPTEATPRLAATTAATAPAIELFIQSARRVQADFTLTAADLPALLQICRLVQGMPLGLEMTAAWVDQMTLAEIAAEMHKSLDFLTLNEHAVPQRQRSLRAVFAWSWQLLSPAEQQSLRRLAIFRGGFTRQAAAAVTGTSLQALSTLVHKSLIQYRANENCTVTPATGGRYVLHELLRQFAYEQLQATAAQPTQPPAPSGARPATASPANRMGPAHDDHTDVARRHSAYYLIFLAQRERRMARDESRTVTIELQSEVDNIRQAWGWATRHGDCHLLDGAAYTLWQFCKYAGLWAEGVELFQQAIDCLRQQFGAAGESPTTSTTTWAARQGISVLSKMLAIQGSCLISLSRHEEALAVAQQAISVARRVAQNSQSRQGLALGYLVQGQALRRTGHTTRARPLLERAVALAQTAQDPEPLLEMLPEIEMRAYGWLCSIALSPDHNHAAAQRFAEANLRLCRRLGKLNGEMIAITDLIDVAIARDDLPMARHYSEKVLQMAEQLGHERGTAASRLILADVVRRQGEYLFAYTLGTATLLAFQQLGDVLQQVIVLSRLGLLSTLMGAYAQAQAWFDQLAAARRAVESSLVEIGDATIALARFELYRGHYGQALRQAQQAQSIAQQLAAPANQAQAALLIGHAHAAQQAWPAATAAYTRALVYANAVGAPPLCIEPQAGLAQVALAQGKLAEAQTYIETILATLAAYPQASLDEPFLIYLICHRVLVAAADPRANVVLQSGHDLLQSYAGNITDPRLHLSFLTAVPTNYALQDAYLAVQAKRR